MNKRLFIIAAIILAAALALSACEFNVERDKEDEFTGEYVEVTEEDEINELCMKLISLEDETKNLSLEYVMAIDAKLKTKNKTYDIGAKLTVLQNRGDDGVEDTFTYFTFGGYSDGNYIKDEFFINYSLSANTTYYHEVATLEENQEQTTSENEYKRSDYKFDAWRFAEEKGYDFLYFGVFNNMHLSDFVIAIRGIYDSGGENGKIFRSGEDKIKIVYTFNEDQAQAYDNYKGCAYYLLLAEDGYKVKVVMTYDENGKEKETDKTVVVSTTDKRAELPENYEEYEEKA